MDERERHLIEGIVKPVYEAERNRLIRYEIAKQVPLTQNPHWKSIAALTPFDIKHFLDFYS